MWRGGAQIPRGGNTHVLVMQSHAPAVGRHEGGCSDLAQRRRHEGQQRPWPGLFVPARLMHQTFYLDNVVCQRRWLRVHGWR